MNWSQAIETVNARYVPGVVQYYAKQTPDPWRAAHDELERVAGILDPKTIGPVLERFVQRCSDLIIDFQNEGKPSKSVSAVDAFIMGDEMQIDAQLSRKRKQCVHCWTKENLKIVAVKPGSLDMMLICKACEPRMGA